MARIFPKLFMVTSLTPRVMFSDVLGLFTKWPVVYWKWKCCLVNLYAKYYGYRCFERTQFCPLFQSTQVFLSNKTSVSLLFLTRHCADENLSKGHNYFHNILSIKGKSGISLVYCLHPPYIFIRMSQDMGWGPLRAF